MTTSQKIDLHNHTSFSQDSKEEMEDMVKCAISKHFTSYGISEHLDYDYPIYDLPVVMTNVAAYVEKLNKMKIKYKDDIELLCGIEFAYALGADPIYIEFDKNYKFDFIINSVHVAEGKDCYFPPYFVGKCKQQAYDSYFQTCLKSLDATYDYQIVGHLGYVARNSPYDDQKIYYSLHKTILDEILRKIIRLEKCLEVNTNVRKAESMTLATEEMLQRYFDLGGRLLTFGADAHQVARVGQNYDESMLMLKKIGFKEISSFCEKKRKSVKI